VSRFRVGTDQNGHAPEDVSFPFHATTVATNALLEQKGASMASARREK